MRLALMDSIAKTASTWAMACRVPTVWPARRCPSAVVAMLNPMLAPVRGRARVVAAERAVAMPQRPRPRRPPVAVVASARAWRCRRGCSCRQELLPRARDSAASAAKPRRWHEPHAPSPPSPVERGARGCLPRRSCSRGWCRFQESLGSDAPADKGGKSRGEDERAPRPRRRHSSGTQQKPSVPSVADQVSDGEVKVTRRRPGDGGGAAARLRVAPLATSASRAKIAVARSLADQGQKRRRRRRSRKSRQNGGEEPHPVFGRTTTARRRITPASGFNPPYPNRVGVP